jgi:hypothetical protein
MTRKEFARSLRRQFRQEFGFINPLPEDADELLDSVEAQLGFTLPPIVRFIYKYAGEDFVNPEWSAQEYLKWNRDGKWPDRLLPLVEAGCGLWLCLDCTQKQVPVVMWRGDYAAGGVNDLIFEPESPSYVDWLREKVSPKAP